MRDKAWIIMAVVAISVILALVILSNAQDEETYCQSFSYYECPDSCVVCPPCEVCSSVSCQTESYCKSIGFDRSWYEGIEERLKQLN